MCGRDVPTMAPDSTPPSRGNPQLDAVDRLRVAALDFRLISSHIKDLAYPLAYGDGEALGEIDDQLQSRLRDLARIEPLLLTVLSDWLQKGCRVGPPCDRDLLPERDARAVAGIRCDSMDPSAHVAVGPPVDCLRKEECDELVRILDAREKALNDEADSLDCLACRVSATTCSRHATRDADLIAAPAPVVTDSPYGELPAVDAIQTQVQSDDLAVVTRGRYRLEVRGESLVKLFRFVYPYQGETHGWDEIQKAWTAMDRMSTSDRSTWKTSAAGYAPTGEDWKPPPPVETLMRYGCRVREALGELGVYWHQDGEGVRWAPPSP